MTNCRNQNRKKHPNNSKSQTKKGGVQKRTIKLKILLKFISILYEILKYYFSK